MRRAGFDGEQTLASLQRMADLLAETEAELWIHHDKAQAASQRRAPAFYD